MDKPAFLADENVHSAIVRSLRSAGFRVISVRESTPGASDQAVLEMARSIPAILITEDSDFGELVFSHGIEAIGVVYLRYYWREIDEISNAVLTLISTHQLMGSFITVTPQKIRERRLP